MPTWLSLFLGSAISVLPSVIPAIPQPFGAIATAALSLGNAIYHLFQPPPTK